MSQRCDPETKLQRVIATLDRQDCAPKQSGGQWSARCPAHDDQVASLSIGEGEGGRVLLRCHAGCRPEAILAALELTFGDLSPTPPRAKVSATRYDICDKAGRLIAYRLRRDGVKGKSIFWFRPDGARGLGGMQTASLPLYGSEHVQEWVPGENILLVEGEKAREALRTAGFRALGTVTGASGSPSLDVLRVVLGHAVTLWPDCDGPGRRHMARIARQLLDLGVEVRVFTWADAKEHDDAFDYLARGLGAAQLRSDLLSSKLAQDWLQEFDSESGPEARARETPQAAASEVGGSQATRLIRLAAGAELFHTPQGEAYATVAAKNHRETHPVRGDRFRKWLQHRWFGDNGTAPGSQALVEAISTLEAQAVFDGPMIPVHVRVGEHQGRLYLDLANSDWEVIEVTPAGWELVESSPIKFRRPRGMQALPRPERGGNIDQLRAFVNLGTEEDFILFISFLVACLRPSGPFPVLVLAGGQGTTKSTCERLVRALLDPSAAPIRALPRTEEDLMIAASNAWVQAYDNVSNMPVWMSDALCRLATGGGLARREFYTNTEETILDAQRPIVLTGIDEVVTRNDLLDRALILTLPTMDDGRRRSEEAFWGAFERVRPLLLGALLDAASVALRVRPGIELPRLPRMADFAVWATAASPKLGWGPGAFRRAYDGNRESSNELALETSPVASAIRGLITIESRWEGTPSELFETIVESVPSEKRRHEGWPANARALSAVIRRLVPNLRTAGVEVSFHRDRTRRQVRLRRCGEICVTSVTSVTGTGKSVSEQLVEAGSLQRVPSCGGEVASREASRASR